MAIAPFPHPTPAGVVADACDQIDTLTGTLWSARSSSELVAGVEELQRLKGQLAALEAELLVEVDARDVARKELAWGSASDWFTHTAGTYRRTGRRSVAHAKLLTGDRAATLEALRAGTVSPEQADVIVAAIEQLPTNPALRRRGEQVLIDEAGRLNATDLARAGRHLLRVIDPDAEDRKSEKDLAREERAAHLARHLSITTDGAGGIRIKGRGSVEDGAILRAALLPLTKPQPSIDPVTCEEAPDPRDHGARTFDALIQLAHHALSADAVPASHGIRTRVVVTIDHDDLHAGADGGGVGVTDDGLDLPATAIRRMACDCDLVRVTRGPDGCVLDVGRTRRLVTPAIWTALVARDHHCAFPGCTRPPVMGHAHHVRHWADGGRTSLDNLVLLCGHHHRTVHHTPWEVRLGDDHRPEFLPPPKYGRPPPEWIRHRPRRE